MVANRWALLGDTVISPILGIVMDVDVDNQEVTICPIYPGADKTTRVTKRINECRFQYYKG